MGRTEQADAVRPRAGEFFVSDLLVKPSENTLLRDGETIHLEPKTMALLQLFAEHVGEVLTRQEIEEVIWQGRVVGYDALTQTIAKLRKALGDSNPDQRIIETVPKSGYRLHAEVSVIDQRIHMERDPAVETMVRTGSRGYLEESVHRGGSKSLIATVGGVLVLAGVAGLLLLGSPNTQVSDPQEVAPAVASEGPPMFNRPRVVVLPIDNLSKSDDDEYLVDGLSEDLTTALAKHRDLFVIARNSAFAYKDRSVSMAELERDLGVRYAVEGSARYSERTIHVNIQLIDVTADFHIWSDVYDGPRSDTFRIQDEIVTAVASSVLPHIQQNEIQRVLREPTKNLNAYELFHRARSEKHKLTPSSLAESMRLLHRALELDPNYAEAYALLGYASAVHRIFTGGGPSYEEALANARKAVELDPTLAISYQAMCQILAFMGRYEEAVDAGYRAIELNPNDAESHIIFSRAASTAGKYDEAVESARIAVRLNPFYPKWYPFILGRALYASGQFEEAAKVASEGMARLPYVPTAVHGVAALARLGNEKEAKVMTEELLRLSPKISLGYVLRAWGFKDQGLTDRFEADLVAGGVPK